MNCASVSTSIQPFRIPSSCYDGLCTLQLGLSRGVTGSEKFESKLYSSLIGDCLEEKLRNFYNTLLYEV